MNWQKWARLVIAVAFVAFAIIVALSFRKGAPILGGHVATNDPKAVVESSEGFHFRHSQSHEDVDIRYGHLTSYSDRPGGPVTATKLDDVDITTVRASGRRFRIRAKQADVSNHESDYSLAG